MKMQDDAPIVGVNITSAIQFQSNGGFQNQNSKYSGDFDFIRENRDSSYKNERRNREMITTFFSTGENSDECIEKLLNEQISYPDLASLSLADLELIGFKDASEREELKSFCSQLPNQLPTYEGLCNHKDAIKYNEKIFNKANSHLETMRAALAASNYKLKFAPPEDLVVGEKSFASRFVLEALTELNEVTDDIDKELNSIDDLLNVKDNKKKSKNNAINYSVFARWILITSIASGALALLLWKLSK